DPAAQGASRPQRTRSPSRFRAFRGRKAADCLGEGWGRPALEMLPEFLLRCRLSWRLRLERHVVDADALRDRRWKRIGTYPWRLFARSGRSGTGIREAKRGRGRGRDDRTLGIPDYRIPGLKRKG